MPDSPTPPRFDVQGHRGARGLVPENTLASFRRALDLGVPTLELDTVVSQDLQVVVSHEPWMDPLISTHPDGRPVEAEEAFGLNVFGMPYAEVARFDVGRRGHPLFPEQRAEPARKPLLREVFALAEAFAAEHGRTVWYNVETKIRPQWQGVYSPDPETFVERLCAEVEAAGVAGRLILQSFDERTLQCARERGLPLRTALLVEPGFMGTDSAATPLQALELGVERLGFVPDIYSPHFRLVTEAVVRRAAEEGMRVLPWTVNEVEEMRRQKDLGVAGLISDYPDRAMPFYEP